MTYRISNWQLLVSMLNFDVCLWCQELISSSAVKVFMFSVHDLGLMSLVIIDKSCQKQFFVGSVFVKSNFLSDRLVWKAIFRRTFQNFTIEKAIFCRIELWEKQFFVGSGFGKSNFLSDRVMRKAIFCRIENKKSDKINVPHYRG